MSKKNINTAATFDDILDLLGVGRFNYLTFVACSSWGLFGAMNLLLGSFIAPSILEFECQIPEFGTANWTAEEKRNFSLPQNKEGYSQCFSYQRNYSNFVTLTFNESTDLISGENAQLQPCSHWNYFSANNLVSEFDLVCDRSYLRAFVQIFFMCGVLTATLLGGYLSDRFGRLKLIRVGFFIFIGCGLLSSRATNLELFLLIRFFVAMSGNFVYLTSYILLIEWCFPRHRTIFGLTFSVPFAMGYMILPVIATYVPGWRSLILTISALSGVLGFNLLIIKESPRWLIQKKRYNEAIDIVNSAFEMNVGHTIKPHQLRGAFTRIQNKNRADIELNDTSYSSSYTCSELCNYICLDKSAPNNNDDNKLIKKYSVFCKLTKIFCLLTLNWFVVNMTYYGLSLNANYLGLDIYVYVFLGGLLEIPCYIGIVPCVWLFGRKCPLIFSFILAGSSTIFSLLVPKEWYPWGMFIVTLFAKLCITAAFQLLYLYTSELFPTNFRTRALSITCMLGKLGSIIAPFITDIVGPQYWKLPLVIFGVSSYLAAIATIYLPETCKHYLPDTVHDVENFETTNLTDAPFLDTEEDGERETHFEQTTDNADER